MKKEGNKSALQNTPRRTGFTLVELLTVIAILAVLSGAAYIGIMRSQARVMNEKVIDDLVAISNALEQYRQDTGHYPNIKDGPLTLGDNYNVSCFRADTTYSHDCDEENAAFLQTQVDNNLLTKRYLQEVPTDPRTHSRYIYGVTTDGRFYQVAGNYLDENDIWIAKVRGNVEKGYRLPSLIRAFDGPNFVMDGETYLPYSPDYLSLTARVEEKAGNAYIDGAEVDENNNIVQPGSTVKTDAGASAILYFSDGSVTYLNGDTELKIQPATQVGQNDEDGIVTKIYLKLFSGKIWNKVVRLAQESEFNVETTTAIAGVRGTEFGIEAGTNKIIILSGTVVARGLTAEEAPVASDPASDGIGFSALPEAADFLPDQEITGTGEYMEYNIPAYDYPATDAGSPLSAPPVDIIDTGVFNNNYRPRVLEVDTTDPNALAIVFEYAAGVEKIYAVDPTITSGTNEIQMWSGTEIAPSEADGTLTVIPDLTVFEGGKMAKFYFEGQTENERTGLSEPAIFIGPDVRLAEADIYNELGEALSDTGQEPGEGGGTVTSIQITDLPEVPVEGRDYPFTVTAAVAAVPVNVSADTTCYPSRGSIDPAGDSFTLTIPDGVTGNITVTCEYIGSAITDTKIVTVLSQLNAACWGNDLAVGGSGTAADKGHWDGEACWVLGGPNDSCDVACTSKGLICRDSSDPENEPPGYPAGTDWDDDGNSICLNLVENAAEPFNPPTATAKGDVDSSILYAPHVLNIPGIRTWCHSRSGSTSNLCSEIPQTNDKRICRCT